VHGKPRGETHISRLLGATSKNWPQQMKGFQMMCVCVCVCVYVCMCMKNKNKGQKLTFFYNFRNTHALHAYLYTY
jgi:hypothetical protein